MQPVVNAAAYRFTPLDSLPELRARLKERCAPLELKGTILLAPEGINVFLAGTEEAISAFRDVLREETGLELGFKLSRSGRVPFRRFRVKIKREIIPGFGPAPISEGDEAPALAPARLKEWLDSGKDCVLLDTRNDYEVASGTFRGATTLGLRNFREFERAAAALPSEMRGRPVVTFCTGGIRCDKAAPLLARMGFGEVYRLDGGILRYFEETGGAHYEGGCFVFDERVALDPALNPSREEAP